MQIALQVHVDTYRGTLVGVPALLKLFKEQNVKATFLFSLGPDNTGRALRRVLKRGFLKKVRRTSVASHYGIKTLLYGVLLPGPNIAKKAGDIMRSTLIAGHEVGIHSYDHVKWQDFVSSKGFTWTKREMQLAEETFMSTFQAKPSTIGAAGWQINKHVLKLEEEMGFLYASDTRGDEPFFPIMGGISSSCVQLPTTLPTLDELIGHENITEQNVADVVFSKCQDQRRFGHVYTLHAELEGQKLLYVMKDLIIRWKEEGYSLVSLKEFYQSLELDKLPRKVVDISTIDGRSGTLAVEGLACD